MPSARCNYCRKPLANQQAVNRHIAHTPKCSAAWNAEFSSRGVAVRVADDATDPVSGPADDIGDFVPPPFHPGVVRERSPSPPPDIPAPEPTSKRARVEEVEDEDDPGVFRRCFESFPGRVASVLGKKTTVFEELRDEHDADGVPIWAPFDDRDDWDLAQWLAKNVTQTATDEFLKLGIVSPDIYLQTGDGKLTSL